jgi:hypothetical protein
LKKRGTFNHKEKNNISTIVRIALANWLSVQNLNMSHGHGKIIKKFTSAYKNMENSSEIYKLSFDDILDEMKSCLMTR